MAEWVALFMDPALREGSPASVREEQAAAMREVGKGAGDDKLGAKGKRSAVAEGAQGDAPAAKRKKDAREGRRPRGKEAEGHTREAVKGRASKETAPPPQPRLRRKTVRRP